MADLKDIFKTAASVYLGNKLADHARRKQEEQEEYTCNNPTTFADWVWFGLVCYGIWWFLTSYLGIK